MGVFTKKIGPVFSKKGNSAKEYIKKLEILKSEANGEIRKEIERQLAIAKYGLIGEEKIAYELKHSGMDMYILHDIYLQHNELSAQIDYIVITQKHIYVIECKNLIGSIEVNNTGDFIRTFEVEGKKIKQRIYSPIEQNERHLRRINELYENTQRNSMIKKLFRGSISNLCKTLVVLANPETLLYAKYAKKEIKEQIVHADLLIKRIKEIDSQSSKKMNVKEMKMLEAFFSSNDIAGYSSYENLYRRLKNQVRSQQENLKKQDDIGKKFNERQQWNLIARLRAFRGEQSKMENIPAYYIFNNAQMDALIEKNPKTKEELLLISGFGRVKVEKYGDAILKILCGQRS